MASKPRTTKKAAPRQKRNPPPSNTPTRHPWTRKDGEIHRAGYRIGYARISTARTLLANPDITVAEVADRLGVSPATLYRYLPAARTANSFAK
jgi:AraC-like DNA-binding protein